MLSLSKLASRPPQTSGPTIDLIFVHGFMGSAGEWQQVASQLSGVDAYAVSLPVHPHPQGQISACDTQISFRNISRQLAAAIQTRGIRRYLLVGYSLGGRLAMYHAARRGQQLHGLVVESAHPGLTCFAQRRARRDSDNYWRQRLAHEPLSQVLSDWYQQPVFASLSRSQRQQMISQRLGLDPKLLAEMLTGTSLAKQPLLTDFLKRRVISPGCSFSYLTGQQDSKFDQIGLALKQSLPDLHLRRAENAGHNIHATQPEWYAEQLQMIIDRILSGLTEKSDAK